MVSHYDKITTKNELIMGKKMKKELTHEQSEELIRRGVPKEYATSYTFVDNERRAMGIPLSPDKVPIFTITDLREIIPREIRSMSVTELYGSVGLYISWEFCMCHWRVGYSMASKTEFFAEELIDALYEVLVWLVKNRIIGFTKPVNFSNNKTNG